MQQASRESLVEELPTIRSPSSICSACQSGKQHRDAFPKQATSKASKPLALVHTDICSLQAAPSFNGASYMLVLADDFTRYTWVYFLRFKSEWLSYFKDCKIWWRRRRISRSYLFAQTTGVSSLPRSSHPTASRRASSASSSWLRLRVHRRMGWSSRRFGRDRWDG